MLQVITDLLGSMITAWILFYAVFKFSGNKINYKSKKFWLCLIGYAVYMIFSYKVTNSFLKVGVNYLILILFSSILIKENVLKLALYSFISAVVITLSEFIFVGVVVSIMKINIEIYKQSFLVSLSTNLGIAFIDYCIINLVASIKIFKEIINNGQEKISKLIIFYLL